MFDTGEVSKADVVLLEEDVNSKEGLKYCVDLYNKGLCREIWAVKIIDTSMIYTDDEYMVFLKSTLDSLGYRIPFRYFIFDVEHPITLHKSMQILDSLKAKNYNNVILVTNAFHSKRSYKVYNKLFEEKGITLQSKVFYMKAKIDDWYKNSYGIRYVIPEILKYFYYVFRGYV